MQTGILITDGGPHPADKWSAISASHICSMISINQNSDTPTAKAARRALPRFEIELADALESHHAKVQSNERDLLAISSEQLSLPYITHNELDEQLATVLSLAKKTPFAEHFSLPNTQMVIRAVLQNHFATVQNIERHWHCDHKIAANDSNEHVESFKASHKPPTMVE